jgi:hypothetical protein
VGVFFLPFEGIAVGIVRELGVRGRKDLVAGGDVIVCGIAD